MQLNELDEIRQNAFHQTTLVKNHKSQWHDKFIKKKVFRPRDWDSMTTNSKIPEVSFQLDGWAPMKWMKFLIMAPFELKPLMIIRPPLW